MENSKFRILIVDDEPSITVLLSRILKKEGYDVKTTTNPRDAIKIARDFGPHLIISDLKMPELNGLELLDELRSKGFDGEFIILTAYGTVENAVEALKRGAFDYLIKPLKSPDELRIVVSKAREHLRLRHAEDAWGEQLAHDLPPNEVIFFGMEEVWHQIKNVAGTNATVLLEGESGTGKSLIAKVIHALSKRKGPFVEVNCAAIPETLIESELFGHEKGAFTGAHRQKKGKFELADAGTIFLDEIGEMPLGAQSKLLRILQERAFERVGGTVTLTTDARIIAATNQDLKERIKERQFREDLYYRLNVFPIRLPALRERKEAIPVIGHYLISQIVRKIGSSSFHIADTEWERLKVYDWPGNIRELHNVLERAAILNKAPSQLLMDTTNAEEVPPGNGIKDEGEELKSLKDIEKEAIEKTLKITKGHRKKTAQILGISLRTLQYKLKEYGLIKN